MTPAATVGLVEWFRPGEHDRVERVIEDVQRLGVRHFRTGISWADWSAPGGRDWYAWLLPRLHRDLEVLPCFHYTPPSLGIEPRTSAPPRDPSAFAFFLDATCSVHGDTFNAVELWNEPNNLSDWDWRLDPGWTTFAVMIRERPRWRAPQASASCWAGCARSIRCG